MPTTLDSASAATRIPARTIRVASVPSNHVYVRHIASEQNDRDVVIERLADPDPADPGRSAVSAWWPPVMLEPDWVRENEGYDILHLHFGFDARSPEDLQRLVEELRRKRVPLVYTVHDLRNPHHETTAEHDAQLDVLVPAADALITLTPGAAEEIRRRWGRRATVLPHPHVIEFETAARLRSARMPRREFRVGVHVKSIRAGMDPLPVIRVVSEIMAGLEDAVLQVNGHRDVLEASGARFDLELTEFLRAESEVGRIDLRVHDYFSDDELWEYLSSLDASVLPYRHGTHSGWLEACRDLGTTVIAPTCGHYADQGPVISYGHDMGDLDSGSLRDAIHTAYRERPDLSASLDERRRQRAMVAREHARIYAEILA